MVWTAAERRGRLFPCGLCGAAAGNRTHLVCCIHHSDQTQFSGLDWSRVRTQSVLAADWLTACSNVMFLCVAGRRLSQSHAHSAQEGVGASGGDAHRRPLWLHQVTTATPDHHLTITRPLLTQTLFKCHVETKSLCYCVLAEFPVGGVKTV